MKHGPIALIDEQMPIVVIAVNSNHYDKVVSNIQEIKSRKGKIIAVVTEGDTVVKELADYIMEVPNTPETLITVGNYNSTTITIVSYSVNVRKKCRSAKKFSKSCHC